MHIGLLSIEIILPDCRSLKEKRSIVKSIIARMRNKFNVSVAETDNLDVWTRAGLSIITISNIKDATDRLMSILPGFIEENLKAGYLGSISETRL